MQAAILAGGLGTRLKSVVADRPKVLAPVAGAPFLAHLLRQLARALFDDVVLLTGYGGERVRDEFGERFAGMRLRYSHEIEPLGTGGAVRLARPMLLGKTILLLNGDSYCDVEIADFADFHSRHGAMASVAVTGVDDASRFGTVEFDRQDRVVRFAEKQRVSQPGWINAGVYLLESHLFESVPAATPCSLERDLLPAWVARGDVRAFRGGEFIDIGVPESYARADAFFQSRSLTCRV